MAKGIKYNLGLRALRKKSALRESVRRFPPFAEVTDVLLAWDENQNDSDLDEIKEFIRFWESHQKNVFKVIYYHKRKKENIPAPDDDNTLHLSKLDFNAIGMPKTQAVKKVMNLNFDYFINLNMDGRLPLKSLAGFTRSACRIGCNRSRSIPFYDLILGKPDDDNLKHYIQDLQHYLQKIG